MNLAVNNLLSRDEEDGDEQEEGDSYIPGGTHFVILFRHDLVEFFEKCTYAALYIGYFVAYTQSTFQLISKREQF